ncbi:hypothetical protein BAS10_13085 [Elizabethkingia meningoseptica]|uniref:hypothetical protein n=1 Tax=Elizabethkingia meningoseptica TaxID=238 RepID=UPI000999F716|nr:hypothetical protein [Elizabethkingia meningoseptica]OPB93731.1 hypothetical protein BAS10_13085 [Elizabethkingia meningoseptica]
MRENIDLFSAKRIISHTKKRRDIIGSANGGRQIDNVNSIYEWNIVYKSLIDDCWNRCNPCRDHINIINHFIRLNHTDSIDFRSPYDPLIRLIRTERGIDIVCNLFGAYSLKLLYMPAGLALMLSGDLMAFDFFNNPGISAKEIYSSILEHPNYK